MKGCSHLNLNSTLARSQLHRLVRSFVCSARLCDLLFSSTRGITKIAYPRVLRQVEPLVRIARIETRSNATVDPSFVCIAVAFALNPPFAATPAG